MIITTDILIDPNLKFNPCKIKFNNDCEDIEVNDVGTICNKQRIFIAVKEDFTSGYQTTRGYFEFTNGLDVQYRIENRPTSQCHVATASHVVTFDQQRFDIHEIGDFVLQRNIQDAFEVRSEHIYCSGSFYLFLFVFILTF